MKRLRTYMEPGCLSACETGRQCVSHVRACVRDRETACLRACMRARQGNSVSACVRACVRDRETVYLRACVRACETGRQRICVRAGVGDPLSPCLARGQTSGLHISPQPLHFMSLESNDLTIS